MTCPGGKDGCWNESAGGAMKSDIDAVRDWMGVLLSVTATVKAEVPAVVGIPDRVPVEAFNVTPVGRSPEEIFQWYGSTPPVAVNPELYPTFIWPEGNGIDSKKKTAGATISDTCAVFDWIGLLLSETASVNVEVPAVVGVPDREPVVAFRTIPDGSAPLTILQ